MVDLCVSKIQRMCFHDGPGMRTTVFLKGCSIRCPWCCNPENIKFGIEKASGDSEVFGAYYDTDTLVEYVMKDRLFWGEDGGVTFSGGEVLMQADQLVPILARLKKEKVHIAIETSLFAPVDKLKTIINYVDYVIADLKLVQEASCKEVLGGDVNVYKENFEYLYRSGRLKLVRIPCCNEFTLTDNNKKLTREFLKNYANIHVQIFKIHNLAKYKYKRLGLDNWVGSVVEDEQLAEYKAYLGEYVQNVEIIKI